MAARPIRMPRPGQMTEECTLLTWNKAEGDPVARGDVLFEIETDKAVMEVEAFDAGVLLSRLVEEGETVPVNSVVAWVGHPGDEIPDAPAAPPTPSAEDGSGQPEPEAAAEPEPAAPAPAPPATRTEAAIGRLRISPRASRLAVEAGLDPRQLTGTGPEGRIVERDVRLAMAEAPSAPMPEARADGEDPPRPLSRMRRVIAERMTLSATAIPQFQITVAVDVTGLVELRNRLKAEGSALTLTDFILVAVAQSLVEMPIVNSRTDGEQLWLRRRVHLGLAVAVPNGLVVAVVRDADHLTIDEIHDRAAGMAAAAREGKLSPDDMTGSTFSISNLGMFGVEHFSAIVNPGESAILAVSSAIRTPVVIGDGIGIRSIMRLTLSADHRLIDGEIAARFLDDLRRRLENPEGLHSKRLDL
ncbi:MAG TPA: dihydrolipoamide acetyltransferase family protein [Candidatus Limnocylindria bacterium]